MHCGHAARGSVCDRYLPCFGISNVAGHSIRETLAAEILRDVEFQSLNSGGVPVIEIRVIDEVVQSARRAGADGKLLPPHGVRVSGAPSEKELGGLTID